MFLSPIRCARAYRDECLVNEGIDISPHGNTIEFEMAEKRFAVCRGPAEQQDEQYPKANIGLGAHHA